jgi:hypothetical protein
MDGLLRQLPGGLLAGQRAIELRVDGTHRAEVESVSLAARAPVYREPAGFLREAVLVQGGDAGRFGRKIESPSRDPRPLRGVLQGSAEDGLGKEIPRAVPGAGLVSGDAAMDRVVVGGGDSAGSSTGAAWEEAEAGVSGAEAPSSGSFRFIARYPIVATTNSSNASFAVARALRPGKGPATEAGGGGTTGIAGLSCISPLAGGGAHTASG